MTAVNKDLGFISYATEGAFAEAVNTDTVRLQPVQAGIDFSRLSHEMREFPFLHQRINDGTAGRRGPKRPVLPVSMELYGHGTATNGSLTKTDLVTLLALLVGNGESTAVGGGMQGAGSNTTTHLDTASCTFEVGDIIAVGAAGDTRAEGRASVVSAFTDNGADEDITLAIALPGAPNNTTDAVYAYQMVYPSTSAAIASTIRVLAASGNKQWWLRGGALAGFRLTDLSQGAHPMIGLDLAFADMDSAAETFPSAKTVAAKVGRMAGGGQLVWEDNGTSTRSTLTVREFTMTFDRQLWANEGTGGIDDHQVVQGWRQLGFGATIEMLVQAPAASTTPAYENWWNSDNATPKQMLYQLQRGSGSSIAIYCPYVVPMGQRFVQEEADGANMVRIVGRCLNDPAASTDKARSAWRIGLG